MASKLILFVTGTRADFGKLKPLIKAVKDQPEYRAHVFATGMHLLSKYGLTINEVISSGLASVHPYFNQRGEAGEPMEVVLANTIAGLSHYVHEVRPSLLVVHGDRVEALAGAIVGSLNNLLVAHIEGGEVSGTIDELMRHATSKLCHTHFVANEEAQTRLQQMGEDKRAIYVIGSPDIDVMLSDSLPSLAEVQRHYEIPFTDYGILMYHPVTTEYHRIRTNAAAVVDGVLASGGNWVVIYPNNDLGSGEVLAAFEKFKGSKNHRIIPSMRFEYFLSLLRSARCIAGNSSAGVREAPVYGVPTINIGTRQNGRYQGPSVRNVPEDSSIIAESISKVGHRLAPSNYFGNGTSANRFKEVLDSPEFWRTPVQKRFLDLAASG